MSVDHTGTLSREAAERKARFRAALAIARLTAHEWAKLNGTHPSYVSRVLSGKTASKPMLGVIDAFTTKHLKKLNRVA